MALFFGYHMPNFTHRSTPDDHLFDRVVEQAQAAEAAGFDMVTVMDHFYQIGGVGPETEPMMEAYTTLGALAAKTSRIQLATLVTGVTYRNPALVAKMVTTLDVISGGRAILGIGAAWNESEHRGYGFEFPPIGQRMDRLDEALTIAKLMFTQENPSFEGKHFRIDHARRSGIGILLGGLGVLLRGFFLGFRLGLAYFTAVMEPVAHGGAARKRHQDRSQKKNANPSFHSSTSSFALRFVNTT